MSIIKIRRGEVVDGSYITSEGFNMFGNPVKYGKSSNADIVPVVALPYLTFKATTANSTLKINAKGIDIDTERNIEYKLSGSDWQPYTAGQVIDILKGTRVQIRNNTTIWSTSSAVYLNFDIKGAVAVKGSIRSLVNFNSTLRTASLYSCFANCTGLIDASDLLLDATATSSCYIKMFAGCTSLQNAPALPSTTVAKNCYNSMFQGCKSLLAAPELHATALADYCYYAMFKDCVSLEQAPVLPALTLAAYCYQSMFNGCTSLIQAPELPAITLSPSCYSFMFMNCKSLTTSPELPATTLADSCYKGMFQGCTSLTASPALPATELANICYRQMFEDCKALITAPDLLPATTLTLECYDYMFRNCSSLLNVPVLPATTLAESCYYSMFNGCTSLTTIPELPATELADYCYGYMFRYCAITEAPALPATKLTKSCYRYMFGNCTSLTASPKLPAAELAPYCYTNMFEGCSNLSTITTEFASWGDGLFTEDDGTPIDCFDGWVNEVATEGSFYHEGLPVEYGKNRIPEGWEAISTNVPDVPSTPLTFTAREAGATVKLESTGIDLSAERQVMYRLDESADWQPYVADQVITLANIGDYVQFKNTTNQWSTSPKSFIRFVFTNRLTASGNVNSLINYSDTLSDYCYYKMFLDCTSLTTAPELPAKSLASWCYYYMFYGCTSLTTAPVLPAKTLEWECYSYMFYDCSSLTTAPALPATTLTSSCYERMFRGCTSLATAPELPATTLVEGCYSYMFSGCKSLNSITVKFTEWVDGATYNWVYGVSSTGTFTHDGLPIEYGKNRIPEGWEVTNKN